MRLPAFARSAEMLPHSQPHGRESTLSPQLVFARPAENCENARMRPSEALAARRDQVLGIAAARGARNLRVFGSARKGLDHEGSDLDLLVELPPGTSLLRIVALQQDIEDALGVKVDLCTERELHPSLKGRILAEACPL